MYDFDVITDPPPKGPRQTPERGPRGKPETAPEQKPEGAGQDRETAERAARDRPGAARD